MKPFTGLKAASHASRGRWYTKETVACHFFLVYRPSEAKKSTSETSPCQPPTCVPSHRNTQSTGKKDPFVLENPVTSVTTFFHSFPSIIFFLLHHCILFFTFTKLIRNICDNCDKNPGSRINRTFRTCHRSKVICDRGFSKKSY